MKNFLCLILLAIAFQACDDGDVIVTTFDFEDANLNLCGNGNQYVFFKINTDVSESISLQLTTNDTLFIRTGTKDYELNGTGNSVNYRRYNGDINASYFCNPVPPTTPTVAINYLATSGTATLNTTTVLDDNDRLEDETGDTDGDGIPDSYDFDDDGDNVPTILELDIENADGDDNPLTNPLDTDGDGTPDYLDADDDGDGILTRNEDLDQNLDPTDDINDPEVGPNYLNNEVSIETTVNEYRQHNYSLTSDVTIRLMDVVLVNGEETIIQENLLLGEIEDVRTNDNVTVIPPFDGN